LLLEIAFEQGLLGIGTLCLFLTAVGISFQQLERETRVRFLVLAMMILYSLLISMFSGDLDDNRVLWFWTGMTMAVCRNVRWQHLANVEWSSGASHYAVHQGYPRASWLRP
jgi:hypothetical protein